MTNILNLQDQTFTQIWNEDFLNDKNEVRQITRSITTPLPSIKDNYRHQFIADFMHEKRANKRLSVQDHYVIILNPFKYSFYKELLRK